MHFTLNGQTQAYPGDGQVLINDNLARILKVGAGDTITLQGSDMHTLTLTVSGVFYNVLYNYAYVTMNTLRSAEGFGSDVNCAYLDFSGSDVYKAAAAVGASDYVMAVTVCKETQGLVSRSLESMVLSGSVQIENDDVWGNKSVLDSIGPGEVFAETYACVPDEPLQVSAVAVEKSALLLMDAARLLRTCPQACAHHGVAQEGGVGKASRLSRHQVAGVLHDDGVMAVQHQVVGRLAGGLAAAQEQHLVAHGHLLHHQLGEAEGLVEAGDGHGFCRSATAGPGANRSPPAGRGPPTASSRRRNTAPP